MRRLNGYLILARALQIMGGLALLSGLKGVFTAGVLAGLGTLIELIYRLLEEQRAGQITLLGVLQKEHHDR